jgi:hypothetical protein
LVNVLKICYERDTFHGARQPDVENFREKEREREREREREKKKRKRVGEEERGEG